MMHDTHSQRPSLGSSSFAGRPLVVAGALIAGALFTAAGAGCTESAPVVDEKLVAALAASERGEIDQHLQRLDIVKRYRAKSVKLLERSVSEVELVEQSQASASALLELMKAKTAHAAAHVGKRVEPQAKEQQAVAQLYVDTLGLAVAHTKLRREYMESFDIAAEDAVSRCVAELEKVKVQALAAAGKIDEAKLKVSEFDVAVRAAQTRYSGHLEAASKVRVALVKARTLHDDKRMATCETATGTIRWVLHCDEANGAPWAVVLPEADTLDRIRANGLKGRNLEVPGGDDVAPGGTESPPPVEPPSAPPGPPPAAPPGSAPPASAPPASAAGQ